MNDIINHPAHYTRGFESREVECIDITRELPFSLGNAFKYVWRAGKKGDLAKAREDLDKARWYLRDVEECGLYTDRLRTAVRMFDRIIPQSSPRYAALRAIVRLDITAAMRAIFEMEAQFELENIRNKENTEK